MENTRKPGNYLRRPTKVTVLNQDYKVEWTSSSSDTQGSCDFNECVITVSKKYPKHSLVDTFIHELLHAINHAMGVTDASTEEEVTTQISRGLCTVWRHNPKVFAWVDKQLTK